MRFFGYVKYVSVYDPEHCDCWVRLRSEVVQEMLKAETPEIVDGHLVVWDGWGSYNGYFIIG